MWPSSSSDEDSMVPILGVGGGIQNLFKLLWDHKHFLYKSSMTGCSAALAESISLFYNMYCSDCGDLLNNIFLKEFYAVNFQENRFGYKQTGSNWSQMLAGIDR